MSNRFFVTITIPLLPELQAANLTVKAKRLATTKDEAAYQVFQEIKRQVRERYSKVEADKEKPMVDVRLDGDGKSIHVIAAFKDKDAAILFKLAHGGE